MDVCRLDTNLLPSVSVPGKDLADIGYQTDVDHSIEQLQMQHTLAGPVPGPATALLLQGGEPRGERPRRERSDAGRAPRADRMERGEQRDGRAPREPREPRERGERPPRRGRGERGDRRGPPPQDSGGARLAPKTCQR